MIIPKLGFTILLTAAAAIAQQPPALPQQPQPPGGQASPRVPAAEAEMRRFESIQARRARSEAISPEDQRFAREFVARTNRVQRPISAAPSNQPAKPPLEHALGVPGGRWWTRPEMAQKLSLTVDQTKKMDDIFQQFRLKLIDLNASLQKEEAIMEPMLGAEQPDEVKIVGQIDKVALARAELEKANARMLLGIRRLLTPEQWSKLKSEAPAPGLPIRPQ